MFGTPIEIQREIGQVVTLDELINLGSVIPAIEVSGKIY